MFSRPSNALKGLSIFISDLRDAATPEEEARRVNSEFAKILNKFSLPTLSGYDYKKYVYKLIYAYILGYDAEIGRMQALNLLASAKISEKASGYLGLSILAAGDPEILRLALTSVKTDLGAPNELVVGLALNFLSNAANGEFIKPLLPEIVRLLESTSPTSLYVRRKAVMVLLRFSRQGYTMDPEQWSENIASFLGESDLGIANTAASLAIELVKKATLNGTVTAWMALLEGAFKGLGTVVTGGHRDTMYYGVQHPWVHVKLLEIIRLFPIGLFTAEQLVQANESLGIFFAAYLPIEGEKLKPTKSVRAELDRLNKLTGEHCIMFAATDLGLEMERSLTVENRKTIGLFLATAVNDRGPNVKYLALERLGKLAATTSEITQPEISTFERKLFDRCRTVVISEIVTGVDAASRRAALAVLVATCDRANWETVVEELLTVLGTLPKETVRCSFARNVGEPTDAVALLKEELALQISLIAERFAPDPSWNVDILFRSLKFAPACVSDAVIRRVLALIAGSDGALTTGVVAGQSQAAERAYEALGGKQSKAPTSVPHNVLALSGFVLGEYGWRLVDSKRVTALRLVEVLAAQLPAMNKPGIGLLALAKIGQRFALLPGVRDEALATIETFTDSLDLDAAQRANEIIALFNKPTVFARLLGTAEAPFIAPVSTPKAPEPASSEDEVADPKTLWKFLCVKPEGVLLASSDLELSVRHSYEGTSGRVQMRFSLRRGIADLRASLVSSDGLSVTEDQQIVGVNLSKGSVLSQTLTVQLNGPFLNPPKYILKFRCESGRETTLPLSLPIILTKFALPLALQPESFSARWSAMGTSTESAIEAEPAMEFSKFSGYLVHGFGFAPVASGNFSGMLEGAASIGGCETLVRISSGVRISVRSTAELTARYCANILASYFVLVRHH